MNIGITVNLGTYESMHFHSGEFDNKRACYEDILDQLLDHQGGYFSARIEFWIKYITEIIKHIE